MDKEMGDLNAYKAVTSKIESSDSTLMVLCNRHEKFENLISDMNNKNETLVAIMAQLSRGKSEDKDKQAESSIPPSTFMGVLGFNRVGSTQPHQTWEDNRVNVKLPKIDFSYFNGDEPREWLRKVKKYFQLHQVAEDFKIGIVEMYLKGKANIWFHRFTTSHPNASWNIFAKELCKRFFENTSKEIVETFNKIRQFGPIVEYQERFEELKALVMMSLSPPT
ncbi:Uncharacterized protein Adt_36043 [Abeliophyllum distichum]|uniref:Retrotransposon gag domain-containing protein n=1 Tax=Abeliophyllum distichum TaxID=126358 RepID=A0ABD1QGH5_9LAMI